MVDMRRNRSGKAAPPLARGGRKAAPSLRAPAREPAGGGGGRARSGKPAAPKRRARRGGGWGWRLARFAATLTVWGFVVGAILVAVVAWDLPDIADLDKAGIRQPQIHILAEDGTAIAEYGDVYGRALRLKDMPPYLPQAVLAIEDRRFYSHFGIDPIGIARAAYSNVQAGGVRQGGSTLTQQLAKSLFLTQERTLMRKAREALLALWLEHLFSKDQLLEIYLNRVYLGSGAYGVDAAARRYFGVSATEVNLTQAAALAGAPKAPSRLNPLSDPKATADRAGLVLSAMVDAGFISHAQADAARRQRIPPEAPRATGSNGRWFADWAMGRAAGYLGGVAGDLVVQTTLDPVLQRILEEEALVLFPAMDKKRAGQLAAVLVAPDGAVRAMLGGRSWTASPFNRAVQGMRQPGSSFKTLVYLAALEAGAEPSERFNDAPVQIGSWRPGNYEGRYRGEVTLAEGVAHSSNAVAVTLAQRVGLKQVIALARSMGIAARLEPTPALALGAYEVSPLEMAGVFAGIANGGMAVSPYPIRGIRDAKGAALYVHMPDAAVRVASPQAIARLNSVLAGVVRDGTGKGAALSGRSAAGKTGTSQDYRDAWFGGYTAELALVIWMGNDDDDPTDRLTGGGLPAELFRRVMTRALAATPPHPLPGID